MGLTGSTSGVDEVVNTIVDCTVTTAGASDWARIEGHTPLSLGTLAIIGLHGLETALQINFTELELEGHEMPQSLEDEDEQEEEES